MKRPRFLLVFPLSIFAAVAAAHCGDDDANPVTDAGTDTGIVGPEAGGDASTDIIETCTGDRWSALVQLVASAKYKEGPQILKGNFAPIHAVLMPLESDANQAQLFMQGDLKVDAKDRDSGLVCPTQNGVYSWASVQMGTEPSPETNIVHEIPPTGERRGDWEVESDAYFCMGHGFTANGTLVGVSGERLIDWTTDITTTFKKDDTTYVIKAKASAIGRTGVGIEYAQILDPVTKTFERVPEVMQGKGPKGASGRWYPGVTRLHDGTLLITSGYEVVPAGPKVGPGRANIDSVVPADPPLTDTEIENAIAEAVTTFNNSVEVYHPERVSNVWTVLSQHAESPVAIQPVDYTHVTVLPEPHVQPVFAPQPRELLMLGAGGEITLMNYTSALTGVDRWWKPADNKRPNHTAIAASSLFLPFADPDPGQPVDRMNYVIVGGQNTAEEYSSFANFYDVKALKWAKALDLKIRRHFGHTLQLPDGHAMVVSGRNTAPDALHGEGIDPPEMGDPTTAQIIDPETYRACSGARWSELGYVGTERVQPDVTKRDRYNRGYHNVAVLLPDGRVWVGGGRSERCDERLDHENDERPDYRYYEPPYLSLPKELGIARPEITTAPACTSYGETMQVPYKNGPIHRAVITGFGAMTHVFDQNARMVELKIVADQPNGDGSGTLTVRAPRDGFVASPGHYMLWLVRDFGVEGRAEELGWWRSRLPSTAKTVQFCPTNPPQPSAACVCGAGPGDAGAD